MPKIMDAHAFEPGVPLYGYQWFLEVGARPVHVGARNDGTG